MIWALLAMYFLGGGSAGGTMVTSDMVKEMGKQVDVVIQDPIRAQAAEDNIDAMRDEIKAFNKKFSNSGKALEKLYKDHDSGAQEMLATLDILNTEWDAAQNRALDLRFALVDSITQEEWAAIVSPEKSEQ